MVKKTVEPKEIKITVVSFKDYSEYDFIPPANFLVMDSLQNYNFIHTSSRKTAQDWVDNEYGKGKYKVVSTKLQKTTKDLTVRGTQTR